MGHSVKGHNGILLPSMLIFTAWAVLLFFLISVNFRICLSSRLTPFLEVPWNLKNKTNNYHWKKADAPEVQGKRHMRGCAWQGAGGATGPSWSLCSLPRRGKCPPVSAGPRWRQWHSAVTVQVNHCGAGYHLEILYLLAAAVRTTGHQCHHCGLLAGELDTDPPWLRWHINFRLPFILKVRD